LSKASGFTLIELMMVLTMGAVLAVVAVSSFKTLTSTSSIQGELNTFVGQMQYARAEALREGSTVSICASSNSTSSSPTCSGGTSWNSGYIVFSDANGNGSYGTGDTLLRKQAAFTTTDTLTASSSVSFFTFNRLGFVNNIAASSVVVMTGHAATPASSTTQCVSVGVVGQLAVQSYGSGYSSGGISWSCS